MCIPVTGYREQVLRENIRKPGDPQGTTQPGAPAECWDGGTAGPEPQHRWETRRMSQRHVTRGSAGAAWLRPADQKLLSHHQRDRDAQGLETRKDRWPPNQTLPTKVGPQALSSGGAYHRVGVGIPMLSAPAALIKPSNKSPSVWTQAESPSQPPRGPILPTPPDAEHPLASRQHAP